MSHFNHLNRLVPSLNHKRILDVGSGEGRFVIDAVAQGSDAIGLEYYPEHLVISQALAKEAGVKITILLGRGEQMPFDEGSFDFVNMSEVLEHVDNPQKVLSEIHRVLRKGGHAYISAPNRYCLLDPHFHLYFINWLPRHMAEIAIGLFGRHKDYEGDGRGRQRLSDMHYYTYRQLVNLLRTYEFDVQDIRVIRIKKIVPKGLLWAISPFYYVCRSLYFDSFHILVTR